MKLHWIIYGVGLLLAIISFNTYSENRTPIFLVGFSLLIIGTIVDVYQKRSKHSKKRP